MPEEMDSARSVASEKPRAVDDVGPSVQYRLKQRIVFSRIVLEIRILNDHMLKDPGPYLGGAEPNLADFLGVAYVTIGEMLAFDFTRYPRVQRWIAAMRARPSWAKANGGFEGWRDAVLAQSAA